jgi:hypothetical protein
MNKKIGWWTSLLLVAWSAAAYCDDAAPPAATRRAHAHNDYYHTRPLLDALQHGFGSVEADVFLVDGKLLVGHGRSELAADRTLQRLYLAPLRQYIARHPEEITAQRPLILLVDIKSDGPATYAALAQLLSRYRDLLVNVEDGRRQPGPVEVIVSGNRPVAEVAASEPRFVGIDGRLEDLPSEAAVDLVPLISDNWTVHFRWRGRGEFPEAERQKLADYVRQVHAEGRRIRFWATPETPEAWGELLRAGVDLINTDDLAGLEAFLKGQAADG